VTTTCESSATKFNPGQIMATYGKRSAGRLRTRIPAKLITLDGEYRVVLSDLSRTGASVCRPGLSEQAGSAVLQWMNFEAFGVIRWGFPGQCGIEFERSIPEAWVLATRSHDEQARLPDDEEIKRRAARDWISGHSRI
jgi:hypothetical protein